jgi:putative ABC transport system permease protein
MQIRQILRRLLQLPAFSVVAVLTIALGIGANTAIFSVINAVMLRPLPYPQPDNLMIVDHAAPGFNLSGAGASPFLYFTYRSDARTLEDVGLWQSDTISVTGLAEPEEVRAMRITQGVMPMFGVKPAIGRLFSSQDDSPAGSKTVLLSWGFWRSRFGGDPNVLGRRVLLDGRATEIIGVLPETFRFPRLNPVLYVPLQLDPNKTFLGNFSYTALARLKPGVSAPQATADLDRLIPISLRRFPTYPGFSLKMFEDARLTPVLRTVKADVVGDVSRVLWVLMGTIGMVLLIACANVASLLLVRADARQQELAVRAAIGAGWGDIARELLLESLALAVMGGLVGLVLAVAALRLLVAAAPANLPRLEEVAIDPTVLLFTMAITVGAGLLFGAIPVLRYAGPQLQDILRGGGRTASQSRERHRARNALVVAQVALALVLLVSAGLMIRTFQALRRVEPGFSRPEEIQTLRISIPKSQVEDSVAVARMEQRILDSMASIPGVTSAALSSAVPMSGQGWSDPIFAEDRVYASGELPPLRRFKFASPGLAKTMGNAIVAGRDLTWTDLYDRRKVALVSENLARELWNQPSAAIGKRIRETLKSPWREIVGVVSDERDDGVDKKAPAIVFWPVLMEDFAGDKVFVLRSPAYIIRTSRAGSEGFLSELNRAVWAVNANLPLATVRTLAEIYNASLAATSFTLVMLAIAGGMALLLGFAGIYGVIAYSVSQRTREIGIRVALGAQAREVTTMFVTQGISLAALGIICGLAGAFALTRLLTSLLFEVNPADPLTYGTVSVSLLAAAMLASYVPALRATIVDPVHALRAE